MSESFLPKTTANTGLYDLISSDVDASITDALLNANFDTITTNQITSNNDVIGVEKPPVLISNQLMSVDNLAITPDTATTQHLINMYSRKDQTRISNDVTGLYLGTDSGVFSTEGQRFLIFDPNAVRTVINGVMRMNITPTSTTLVNELISDETNAFYLRNNSGQIRIGDNNAVQGTAAAPAIVFAGVGNTFNTGIYASATGVINITCAGSSRLSLNTTVMNTTGNFRTQGAGSVTAPSVQITDANTGFYRIVAGQLGLTTSGVLRCDWSSTRMNLATPLYLPNGTGVAPALTFSGDTNTGIFSVGSDIIGVSCGGITGASFTSGGPFFSGAVTANRIEFSGAGTTTVPALSFSSNTTTGLYNPSAFTLGIVSGGNESARFSTTGAILKNTVTVDQLQVTSTGKILYWSDWGLTTTIASVPSGGANNFTVNFGTTAPTSTIAVSVTVINGSNPDRITVGCNNLTTTGFELYYVNNYNLTVTNLRFAWTARV